MRRGRLPTRTAPSEQVVNGGFDNGTSPWYGWGDPYTTLSTVESHSGSYSCRETANNCPIHQYLCPTEKIANGEFENGFDNWQVSNAEIDTVNPKSGINCAKLSALNSSIEKANINVLVESDNIWSIGFWAHGTASPLHIKLTFNDSSISEDDISISSGWTYSDIYYLLSPYEGKIIKKITFTNIAGSSIWVDGVSLIEIGVPVSTISSLDFWMKVTNQSADVGIDIFFTDGSNAYSHSGIYNVGDWLHIDLMDDLIGNEQKNVQYIQIMHMYVPGSAALVYIDDVSLIAEPSPPPTPPTQLPWWLLLLGAGAVTIYLVAKRKKKRS
jgi:hypothetical protein